MTFTRRIFILVLITILASCSTVPGSHISQNLFKVPFHDSNGNEKAQVNIIKITPSVVSHTDFRLERNLPALPKFETTESYDYRIGVGDVLSIIVWDHPELTAPFGSFNNAQEQGNVVREDGSIFYPFVGRLLVEGRTARDVRDQLARELSNFIEQPQLDVRVVRYRSQRYFVTGSVIKPGSFPITDVPVKTVEAIGIAGGLRADADLFDVTLSRDNQSFNIPLYEILYEGKVEGNTLLRHGDILHFAPNERRKVFIMGEVVSPRSIPMTNRKMSLTQALSEAGGIQEARADGRGVYVVRNSEYSGLIDVYQLDLSEAWSMALGDHFDLQPRDVVYVTAAPISRWNRWVSNILPSLQGLYSLDQISAK